MNTKGSKVNYRHTELKSKIIHELFRNIAANSAHANTLPCFAEKTEQREKRNQPFSLQHELMKGRIIET